MNLAINQPSEQSPQFLSQRSASLVNWIRWGEEARLKAVRQNQPLFIHLAYEGSSWCRRMWSESFCDPAVAEFLNTHFVSIYLDRDERPDLEAFCFQVVQEMQSYAGWPLNVFLRPDQKPFFGGSYFPTKSQFGQPGFLELLQGIQRAWSLQEASIQQNADALSNALVQSSLFFEAQDKISNRLPQLAVKNLHQIFDQEHGGFGKAPKFFHCEALHLLLESGEPSSLDFVEKTLRQMSDSPIRDQVRGGFYRFAAEADWSKPSSEKTLADNAFLMRLFAHINRLRPDESYARRAEEIHAWSESVLKRGPAGYSSMTVEEAGVLSWVDQKVLTSVNALLITAWAQAGREFDRPEWIQKAQAQLEFYKDVFLRRGDLPHLCLESARGEFGFLEDAAFMAEAAMAVFGVSGRVEDLDFAVQLTEHALQKFEDSSKGGFFVCPQDRLDLWINRVDIQDSAQPSAYAVFCDVLWALYRETGEMRYASSAERAIRRILKTAELKNGGYLRLARVVQKHQRDEINASSFS